MKKLIALIFVFSTLYGDYTWQGTTVSLMSFADNWTPMGPPPNTGQNLGFPQGVSSNWSYSPIDDLGGTYSVASININSTTAYTLVVQVPSSFSIVSGSTLMTTGAQHQIQIPLILGGPWTVTPDNSGVKITGNISGAGTLTLTGGLLILAPSGSNTFGGGAGTLTINSGATLSVPTVGALSPTGISVIVDNGTLVFTEQGNESDSQTINGSGVVQMNGPGTLTLGGTNGYTGGTQILQGTLGISADTNLGTGTITLGAATLQLNQNGGVYALPIILTTNGSISTMNNNVTLNNVISESPTGAGSLNIVAGTGTVIMAGNNTYSAGTRVVSGILQITNSSNIGTGLLVMGTTSGPSNLSVTSSASISNGVFLTGTASILGNGHSVTFSKQIKGAGPLTITPGGGGIVTFSSANGAYSYTGGTILTNGTLIGDTKSLQGTFSLSAGSTLEFDQSFNGTYAGTLSSSGALLIDGSGIVTFSGDSGSSYTGAVSVTGGTLNVTGSLQGSAITVGSGGALTGSGGTVGAVTVSGGTLGPNGIGTLNIDGNLTMNTSPKTIVNIAPKGSSDLFSVTGTAAITGSLTVDPEPGFYGFGSTYTIIDTTGGVSGTFSPVSAPANFNVTPKYSADEVQLIVQILQPFYLYKAANYNEQSVANNINALAAAGVIASNTALVNAIDALEGYSNEVIDHALDQLHPAIFSALTEMQVEVGSQLVSMFHRRPGPVCCDNTYRIWVTPFGNWLEEGSKGIQRSFGSHTKGFAGGFDWELRNNLVLGFGGVIDHSDLTWHHQGHTNANTYYGAAYFDYTYKFFYLGAAVLGGIDHYNTARKIRFTTIDQTANSSHNAVDIIGQLNTGLFFGPNACCFYPYFNVDYLYLGQNSFNENGAGGLDLDVRGINDQTVRTELGFGLKVQDTNYRQTMCISPSVNLGWIVQHPVNRKHIISSFQGEPISFDVIGWDYVWELFTFGFGLDFTYKCFTLGGQYDGEFSSDGKFWAQRANGHISYKW